MMCFPFNLHISNNLYSMHCVRKLFLKILHVLLCKWRHSKYVSCMDHPAYRDQLHDIRRYKSDKCCCVRIMCCVNNVKGTKNYKNQVFV